LVSISGSIPPTSKNKMYSADRVSKNYGGQLSMLTLAPKNDKYMKANRHALEALLESADSLGNKILGGLLVGSEKVTLRSRVWRASNEQLKDFLKAYHWLEDDFKYPARPPEAALQLEFLSKQKHGIGSWLIVAPQRLNSFGDELILADKTRLTVKRRDRTVGRGFQVFGEPQHRIVADYLADVKSKRARLVSPNPATAELQDKNRGVCLLYTVRQRETDAITVGFELLFPANDLPFEIAFRARTKDDEAPNEAAPADRQSRRTVSKR
jgi:hypothetical protein